MKLRRFDTIQAFWDDAQDYLLQYEAEHNLLLGIIHTLRHYPERYPNPSYLAIVEEKGQPLAIAICTPPHKLLLSKALDFDALRLIAQNISFDSESYPGVSGLVAEVEAFVRQWCVFTQKSYRKERELRIHQLNQVEYIPEIPGLLKPAIEDNRALLLDWYAAFEQEVNGAMWNEIEKAVNGALKRQSAYLWIDDGIPVSLVAGSSSLPKAARLGPVYTPPKHRRRGYATGAVSALSQQFLERECHCCYLFTDIANPTSNHIYQAIGYRPICDWHDYAFIQSENSD